MFERNRECTNAASHRQGRGRQAKKIKLRRGNPVLDFLRNERGCDRQLTRGFPQNFSIGQLVKVLFVGLYEIFKGCFRVAGNQWRDRLELAPSNL